MWSVTRAATDCASALHVAPCSPNWSPVPAVARQKLIGFLRPLATSRIERKPIRSHATPCIEERLHHSPTGLDPIRPLEQDRVPDHAIIDQRLVAGARCGVKINPGI